jgi:hypothetical protein
LRLKSLHLHARPLLACGGRLDGPSRHGIDRRGASGTILPGSRGWLLLLLLMLRDHRSE